MGNEQPTSYDLPTGIESMEPEEAAATLSKIYADVGGNAKHPYSNTAHPQSKDFRAAVTRLHEIKNPEPEPQVNEQGEVLHNQYPQDVVDAMAEGLELRENRNAEVQAERIEQAESEMDLFEKASGTRENIPEDISEVELRVLTMRRLAVEGDFLNLNPRISKSLIELNAPPENRAAFEALCNLTNVNEKTKKKIYGVLIADIFENYKFKEGI